MVGLSIRFCAPLREWNIYPDFKYPCFHIHTSVQKHYQSEVCVVCWIHEEVDYNVQALVFIEPKDHLERLHLRGKVTAVP